MQSKTATAILVLGIGIGLAAGWVVTGLVSPLPQARIETPVPGEGEALARERRARIEAEAARDSLARELAGRPAEAAAVAPASSGATPLTRAADVLTPPAPEAARGADPSRLLELERRVREAVKSKNQKSALALLREIAPLGRTGWHLAQELIPLLTRSPYEPLLSYADKLDPGMLEEPERNTTNFYELTKVLSSDNLVALYLDALADTAHATPALRRAAATWLPAADPARARELFSQMLATEQDEVVATTMIQAFFTDHEPEAIAAVVGAVRGQPNAAVRLMLTAVLADNPVPTATIALECVARGDPDEKVRQAARVALVTRDPPVAGVMVTDVVDEGQAARAGLRVGDIIVSYRGIPTLTLPALQAAKLLAQKNEFVLMGIWRDGQVQMLQLQEGQIGINGHGVRPAGAPAPEGEEDR